MTLAPELSEVFIWEEYAACEPLRFRNQNDNPFFLEGYGAQYTKARKYCCQCPVVIDCLIFGLDNELGMWGCTSPNERTSINNMLNYGMSLKNAVESVWKQYRYKNSSVPVPPKSIWKDWDA